MRLYKLPKLKTEEYQQLTQNSVPLKEKYAKPYVLLTPDDRIVKHIYLRGFFSSSTLLPYSVRFIRNVNALKQLGHIVPEIHAIYHYPQKKCDLIVYQNISGKTLFQHFNEGQLQDLKIIAILLAQLHTQGIYFKDLHSKNIIYRSDGSIAFIDLASVKRYSKALNLALRIRSLARIINHEDDKHFIASFGEKNFLEAYFAVSRLSAKECLTISNNLLERR